MRKNQKITDEAKKRWNNGGKEIYEALQKDPEFVHSEAYNKYFRDNNIDIPENDVRIELLLNFLVNGNMN